MQQFTHTVQLKAILHAQPAGQLARAAKSYEGTTIKITKGCKTVKASQMLLVMGLAIADGDTIVVTAEGPEEEEAIMTMRNFFMHSLI